jgi:hypothetical protein
MDLRKPHPIVGSQRLGWSLLRSTLLVRRSLQGQCSSSRARRTLKKAPTREKGYRRHYQYDAAEQGMLRRFRAAAVLDLEPSIGLNGSPQAVSKEVGVPFRHP